MRLSGLFLGLLLLCGCRNTAAPKAPYIRGQITSISSETSQMLVEVEPTKTIFEAKSGKSMVTWNPSTSFRTASGQSASVGQLKVGMIVSVWITGIVLDSYPDQVQATDVVIE